MEFGLRGKVALVTAASEGLGKATAQSLAREGTTLVICSRRRQAIERTAAEIREETGVEVFAVAADVSRAASVSAVMRVVKRRCGTLHILVNNAGGPPTGDIHALSDAAWRRALDLTLMSAVRFSRAALPMMAKQRWGRIITIASITAKQPLNDLLLSSVFRPGILGLSKVLSNTCAKDGITVNTVLPGFILTQRQHELMGARARRGSKTVAEYMASATAGIPAGRFGAPAEIGDVIAFLASERASYINGANLLVDGGMARGIH